jgi:hypothetical protein
MNTWMASLPYALDLAGTFVFALSGAMAGVRNRLDVFGVLVLSFAAANTGGITRYLLIGAVPPGAIRDWHYLGVSLLAGLVTFYFPSLLARFWSPVLLFDAAGLALFAVSGAQKALASGLNPVMATLLGMLTGIGGGLARRGRRRGREHAAVACRCGGARRSGPVLRVAHAGHPARLAPAGGAGHRRRHGRHRSGGRREAAAQGLAEAPVAAHCMRPNLPALKSSMACTISAWLFITKGP